jgi:uncharacterized repeat protein (TIGR02543 family)
VFTATWLANEYKITYVLNGVINADMNPSTYTYGEGVTSFANASKRGYNFVSWTPSSISNTATGDKVVEATWSPITYTISYELNGGENNSSNPSTYTIESGTITLVDPSKTGYEFAGWTQGNKVEEGSVGNKTFTARWEAISYPITYVMNG